MPVTPIDTDQIVVTASRAPESEAQTPASVTIVDQQRIERLGEPLASALLRLIPSTAVTQSGSAGIPSMLNEMIPARRSGDGRGRPLRGRGGHTPRAVQVWPPPQRPGAR